MLSVFMIVFRSEDIRVDHFCERAGPTGRPSERREDPDASSAFARPKKDRVSVSSHLEMPCPPTQEESINCSLFLTYRP